MYSKIPLLELVVWVIAAAGRQSYFKVELNIVNSSDESTLSNWIPHKQKTVPSEPQIICQTNCYENTRLIF